MSLLRFFYFSPLLMPRPSSACSALIIGGRQCLEDCKEKVCSTTISYFTKGYYSYMKINICVHYLYVLRMESWKIFIWPHHTKQFLHVLRSARTKVNGGGAGEFFFKVVSSGVRFIVKATHMSLSISCMTKYD